MDGTDRLCISERAQCIPCRVLHLRHLPTDVSEQEVLALALPFGRVSKLITLKTKNQVSRDRSGLEVSSFHSRLAGDDFYDNMLARWDFVCFFKNFVIWRHDFNSFFQGFLEMASEEAAVTMINYYTTAPPTIRNQPVFIQYSTHRELKTDNLHNQARISSFFFMNEDMHFKTVKANTHVYVCVY